GAAGAGAAGAGAAGAGAAGAGAAGGRRTESPRAGADGGFGLPAMRSRAEALGGTFAVESAPGQGTAVAVTLPWPVARDTGGGA
ncbi:ATP-binding protein, partial [Streptomyces sp. NPDC058317]